MSHNSTHSSPSSRKAKPGNPTTESEMSEQNSITDSGSSSPTAWEFADSGIYLMHLGKIRSVIKRMKRTHTKLPSIASILESNQNDQIKINQMKHADFVATDKCSEIERPQKRLDDLIARWEVYLTQLPTENGREEFNKAEISKYENAKADKADQLGIESLYAILYRYRGQWTQHRDNIRMAMAELSNSTRNTSASVLSVATANDNRKGDTEQTNSLPSSRSDVDNDTSVLRRLQQSRNQPGPRGMAEVVDSPPSPTTKSSTHISRSKTRTSRSRGRASHSEQLPKISLSRQYPTGSDRTVPSEQMLLPNQERNYLTVPDRQYDRSAPITHAAPQRGLSRQLEVIQRGPQTTEFTSSDFNPAPPVKLTTQGHLPAAKAHNSEEAQLAPFPLGAFVPDSPPRPRQERIRRTSSQLPVDPSANYAHDLTQAQNAVDLHLPQEHHDSYTYAQTNAFNSTPPIQTYKCGETNNRPPITTDKYAYQPENRLVDYSAGASRQQIQSANPMRQLEPYVFTPPVDSQHNVMPPQSAFITTQIPTLPTLSQVDCGPFWGNSSRNIPAYTPPGILPSFNSNSGNAAGQTSVNNTSTTFASGPRMTYGLQYSANNPGQDIPPNSFQDHRYGPAATNHYTTQSAEPQPQHGFNHDQASHLQQNNGAHNGRMPNQVVQYQQQQQQLPQQPQMNTTNITPEQRNGYKYSIPNLRLSTFDGEEESDFPTFWDVFLATVESNDQIAPVIKFATLHFYLKGDPKRLISSLPITDANYPIALQLLHSRYGNRLRIRHKIQREMFQIPPAKLDLWSLNHTYTAIQASIMKLITSQQNAEHFSVVNSILSKFPKEILSNASLLKPVNQEWTTQTLMTALNDVILRRTEMFDLVQDSYNQNRYLHSSSYRGGNRDRSESRDREAKAPIPRRRPTNSASASRPVPSRQRHGSFRSQDDDDYEPYPSSMFAANETETLAIKATNDANAHKDRPDASKKQADGKQDAVAHGKPRTVPSHKAAAIRLKSKAPVVQRQVRPCAYCTEDHRHHQCTSFRMVKARIARLIELKRCLICLETGHMSKECPVRNNRVCTFCNQRNHHLSLCYKQENQRLGRRYQPGPRTTNANESTEKVMCVQEYENSDDGFEADTEPGWEESADETTPTDRLSDSDQESEYDLDLLSQQDEPIVMAAVATDPNRSSSGCKSRLLITTIRVANSDKETSPTTIHAFLDSGSSRSWITPGLAAHLELGLTDHGSMTVNPFSVNEAHQQGTRVPDVTAQLNLLLSTDQVMTIDVTVAPTRNMIGRMLLKPLSASDTQYLSEHGLTNSLASTKVTVPTSCIPDLILGMNCYTQLMYGTKDQCLPVSSNTPIILPSGLQLIPSLMGYVLGGSSNLKDTGEEGSTLLSALSDEADMDMTEPLDDQTVDPQVLFSDCSIYPEAFLRQQGPHIQEICALATDGITDAETALVKELQLFQSLDSLGIHDRPDVDENALALMFFKHTVRFTWDEVTKDPRIEVSFPPRPDSQPIPSNKNLAYARFKAMSRKLHENPAMLLRYHKGFTELLDRGVIERAPEPDTLDPDWPIHYLAHHPIIKEDHETTQLRTVYDCSAKATEDDLSLNQAFLKGDTELADLGRTLIRCRQYRYLILSDLEKAFLMLLICAANRNLTRFFWYDDLDHKQIVCYWFRRLIFGFIAAPHLLGSSVRFLIDTKGGYWCKLTRDHWYADNFVSGVDDVNQAKAMEAEITEVFKTHASFNVREWQSNCAEFVDGLPEERRMKNMTPKVLGVKWTIAEDLMSLMQVTIDADTPIWTRRKILSAVNSVFDPYGLSTPLTLSAKLLLQKIVFDNGEWDAPIAPQFAQEWLQIIPALLETGSLSVPRYFQLNITECDVTLHGFADASAVCFASVVYIRLEHKITHEVQVHFVTSKSRLNPNFRAPLSIVRMELMALWILIRQIKYVREALNLTEDQCWTYTDNQCVLHWLQSKKPLGVFVNNRVKAILSSPRTSFHFVRTADNISDICTREGVRLPQLQQSRWLTGPIWLHGPPSSWPTEQLGKLAGDRKASFEKELRKSESPGRELILTRSDPSADIPETKQVISKGDDGADNEINEEITPAMTPNELILALVEGETQNENIWPSFMARFSKLLRLLRSTTYLLRFLKQRIWSRIPDPLKQKCDYLKLILRDVSALTGPITHKELKSSHDFLLARHQATEYPEIFNAIYNEKPNAMVSQMGIRIDSKGILRGQSRVTKHSSLPDKTKYPKLLPKAGHFTKLIIVYLHEKFLHSSAQYILAQMNQAYWLPAGRSVINSIVGKCTHCRKLRGPPYRLPKMGPLPLARTERSTPYQTVGLDLFGPTLVYQGCRCRQPVKVWVILYTCFVTRCVSLDVVGDLSSEQMIMALKRFVSTRGSSQVICSDNAPQFVATKELWTSLRDPNQVAENDSTLLDYCANEGMEWQLIPSHMPTSGGCWERLVQVIKRSLKAAKGRAVMEITPFRTLLAECEAIANARPITYVTNSLEEITALRPIDLWIPKIQTGTPRVNSEEINDEYLPHMNTQDKLLRFYSKSQTLLDRFWNMFRDIYLPEQRERMITEHRHPHSTSKSQPSVGDVVLIKGESLPRGAWRLGRVMKLMVSKDQAVRVAELKTCTGNMIRRPLSKLYPLECEEPRKDEEEDEGHTPPTEPTTPTIQDPQEPEEHKQEGTSTQIMTRSKSSRIEQARNLNAGRNVRFNLNLSTTTAILKLLMMFIPGADADMTGEVDLAENIIAFMASLIIVALGLWCAWKGGEPIETDNERLENAQQQENIRNQSQTQTCVNETSSQEEPLRSSGHAVLARGSFTLPSQSHVSISTGVKIHSRWTILVTPRLALGERGVVPMNGVIGPNYTGEIKVTLFNHSKTQVLIKKGDCLARLVFVTAHFPTTAELSLIPRLRGALGYETSTTNSLLTHAHGKENGPTRPVLIVVAGGIGSGKSSLLAALSRVFSDITVRSEHLSKWCFFGRDGTDVLALQYSDAFAHTWKLTLLSMESAARNTTTTSPNPIVICERDLLSNKAFLEVYKNQIPRLDYDLLNNHLEFLLEIATRTPDLYISLKVSTSCLLRRIRTRARSSEAEIKADLLDQLEEETAKVLSTTTVPVVEWDNEEERSSDDEHWAHKFEELCKSQLNINPPSRRLPEPILAEMASVSALPYSHRRPGGSRTRARTGVAISSVPLIAFCLLSTMSLCFASDANSKCPESEMKGGNLTVIDSQKCLVEGTAIYQRSDGTYCWYTQRCYKMVHNQKRYFGKLDGKGKCAHTKQECACAKGFDHCSIYKGTPPKASGELSEILNYYEPTYCSIQPDQDCNPNPSFASWYVILPYDSEEHYVTSLNVREDETQKSMYSCIGDSGKLTGDDGFCESHICEPGFSKKICYYKTVNPTMMVTPAGQAPLRAWTTRIMKFYGHLEINETVREWSDAEVNLACSKKGVVINLEKSPNMIRICSGSYCYTIDNPSTQVFSFPPDITIQDHEVLLKVWADGKLVKNVGTKCQATPFCELVECYFCLDYLANPTCAGTPYIVLLLILFYFSSFALFIVLKSALILLKFSRLLIVGVFKLCKMICLKCRNKFKAYCSKKRKHKPLPNLVLPELDTLDRGDHRKEPSMTNRSRPKSLYKTARAPSAMSGTDSTGHTYDLIESPMEGPSYFPEEPANDINLHNGSSSVTRTYLQKNPRGPSLTQSMKSAIVLIMLIHLHSQPASACAEAVMLTTDMRRCVVSKNGTSLCKVSSSSRLNLAPANQLACLVLSSETGEHGGSLQIQVKEMNLLCDRKILYYTRDVDFQTNSMKRCPSQGSCSSQFCGEVTKDSDIEELSSAAKDAPGITRCSAAESGWFSADGGCFSSGFSCLFFRYFCTSTSQQVYTVFSCPSFTFNVEILATFETETEQKSHAFTLTAGKVVKWNNMSFSVIGAIQKKLTLLASSKFVVRGDKRMIITPASDGGSPISNKIGALQCTTHRAAAQLSKKDCFFSKDSCHCTPSDNLPQCACNVHSVAPLFQDKETQLPLVSAGYTIEGTENGGVKATFQQASTTEIQVDMHNVQVSTKVNKNHCKITPGTLKGCYSCLAGAQFMYTCKTDFGRASAYVECEENVRFISQCEEKEVSKSVVIPLPHADVNLKCTVTCPSGVSKFQLTGQLYFVPVVRISEYENAVNKENTGASGWQLPSLDFGFLGRLFASHWFVTIAVVIALLLLAFLTFPLIVPCVTSFPRVLKLCKSSASSVSNKLSSRFNNFKSNRLPKPSQPSKLNPRELLNKFNFGQILRRKYGKSGPKAASKIV